MQKQRKPDTSRIVPDTSILVDGALSKQLSSAQLEINEIIIHEAVVAELEAQANRRKDTGYLGLDEIERIIKEKTDEIDRIIKEKNDAIARFGTYAALGIGPCNNYATDSSPRSAQGASAMSVPREKSPYCSHIGKLSL